MLTKNFCLVFWSVRLLSVFLVQTWFVPDEFWQSMEVAHRLSFGYGHLTWEWTKGIRSWLYPMSIAIIYKHLENFGLDHRLLLICIPRILQTLLTAHSEWTFSKALSKIFSQEVAHVFIFLQTASWYMFYTASRTLGNTFELSLILYGLSFYLLNHKGWIIFFMLISIYNRPTSGAFWLPLMLYFVAFEYKWLISRKGIKAMFTSSLVIGFLACLDSLLYGRWTLVPFNFLMFNFFSNAAQFYGHHVWHWYLSNALPSILGPIVLPILVSPIYIFRTKKRSLLLALSASCLSYIIFHSLVAHKEIRFLSPIVPVLNTIAAYVVVTFSSRWRRALLACVLLSNIPVGAYLSVMHQRGVMDAIDSISAYVSENDTVLFLMPCHSTPFYSHVHVNATMRFLTCLPVDAASSHKLSEESINSYLDEADRFYISPIKWLEENVTDYPDFLVMFDNLIAELSSYLNKHSYRLQNTIFHSHVREGRVGKHVLIFKKLK